VPLLLPLRNTTSSSRAPLLPTSPLLLLPANPFERVADSEKKKKKKKKKKNKFIVDFFAYCKKMKKKK